MPTATGCICENFHPFHHVVYQLLRLLIIRRIFFSTPSQVTDFVENVRRISKSHRIHCCLELLVEDMKGMLVNVQ